MSSSPRSVSMRHRLHLLKELFEGPAQRGRALSVPLKPLVPPSSCAASFHTLHLKNNWQPFCLPTSPRVLLAGHFCSLGLLRGILLCTRTQLSDTSSTKISHYLDTQLIPWPVFTANDHHEPNLISCSCTRGKSDFSETLSDIFRTHTTVFSCLWKI